LAQWRVHVQGEQIDLKELRDILAANDPAIIEDGNNFYLTSKAWNQSDDATAIHNRAKEFIQLLEDAAYFHFRDTAPLKIGGVVRIDDSGVKHHFIIAEVGKITLRGARVRAVATVGGPGNQPSKQEHLVTRLLRASKKNSNVQDALKFYRNGNWFNLYKVYELVKDDVNGEKEILSRKWISKTSLKRFTQMAQSRAGLGDDARHASKKYKPPAKAMSLTEAKTIIGTLLQNWINYL
jgi:hypothetical protein